MPSLSFPLKILLAMMLVVAGVTGATLYITQKRVQTAYREVFAEQFETQAYFFLKLQEARLSAVQEKCLAFVRSVRLLALMDRYQGEPGAELARDLYQTAETQLGLLGIDPGMIAFRFIDEKGGIIPPLTNAPVIGLSTNSVDLGRLRQALQDEQWQQTAYLEATGTNGMPILQEGVFTKIIDREKGEAIGGLMLAYALPDIGEMNRRVGGKSALLLNAHLYGSDITDEMRRAVADVFNRDFSKKETPEVSLGGTPHVVFHRLLNPKSAFAPAYQVTFFSLENALKQQRDLRWQILGFGSLALVGALGVSLLLSQGLTAPIKDLVGGAAQISEGNYAVKVRVRSRDEIGRLTSAFNDMATGLALKEKYRSVLDMVADKGIAEELMQGKITLGGETRRVSVLFCDIRGFTALTEKMSPPEVIQMLNEHFTPLTKVVYEHHGVVDKYVGDLIMAIFGAPKSFGSDALNAARCALRMIEERQKLNSSSRYGIAIGIGVASGEAVAGRMGSADRLNYTVLGERVNLASRLCSRAGKMEVVIDTTTRAEIGQGAVVDELEPMALKGFAAPVPAFKLRSINA
jgi:class 3 adenylate cyclase